MVVGVGCPFGAILSSGFAVLGGDMPDFDGARRKRLNRDDLRLDEVLRTGGEGDVSVGRVVVSTVSRL